jgi:hypothetical protein
MKEWFVGKLLKFIIRILKSTRCMHLRHTYSTRSFCMYIHMRKEHLLSQKTLPESVDEAKVDFNPSLRYILCVSTFCAQRYILRVLIVCLTKYVYGGNYQINDKYRQLAVWLHWKNIHDPSAFVLRSFQSEYMYSPKYFALAPLDFLYTVRLTALCNEWKY